MQHFRLTKYYQIFTLSDDMLLTREHVASDVHTPLFGPVMSFKTNSYSTTATPTDADAARFGEKVSRCFPAAVHALMWASHI
jgi:hypothetical protein